MPWELKSVMDADIAVEGLRRLAPIDHIRRTLEPDPRKSFARVATLEASLYLRNQLLRDTDWASMAHSLEVRPPLVDTTLLRKLTPVLVARSRLGGKHLLAQSPRQPLFGESTARAKSGFTTPVESWIQATNPLRGWEKTPDLSRADCHWARRWAYSVANGMTV